MFGKKKIPNPDIEKFETQIKKRGLLLVKASFSYGHVVINVSCEFVNFAKRSKVGTVFKEIGYDNVYYYYIVNGIIVYTYLKRMVEPTLENQVKTFINVGERKAKG